MSGLQGATPLFTIVDESDLDDLDITPYLCERCGNPVAGAGSAERNCHAGHCVELRCAQCDFHWAGWGPVRCPCQRRDPKIRRIRQLYRARRS